MQVDRLVNKQKKQYIISVRVVKHASDNYLYLLLLIAASLLGVSNLRAGNSSATVQVSAVVASNCKLNSGEVQFGTYDPADVNAVSALNAAGSVQISCTKNTTATISIDQGQYASQATSTSRAMKSQDGSSYLSYDLYLDAGYSTVWNTVNQETYTSTGGITPTSIAIYGKVPANQDVIDGQYNDVVTVTATF
ncbi:MAG TPA: spore coat U domain-containing protein [Gammaproteobacteria bacterium]|jgi:spore coat protein U-like protein|nr:spore coat U domain-containing protein [Gammaproteobacteria bacterium]